MFAHCLRNFRLSTKNLGFFFLNKEVEIFCVFASVACISIGKDGEYEKTEKRIKKMSDSVCNDLNSTLTNFG